MPTKIRFKSCGLKCPQCKNIQYINRRMAKLKKKDTANHYGVTYANKKLCI